MHFMATFTSCMCVYLTLILSIYVHVYKFVVERSSTLYVISLKGTFTSLLYYNVCVFQVRTGWASPGEQSCTHLYSDKENSF